MHELYVNRPCRVKLKGGLKSKQVYCCHNMVTVTRILVSLLSLLSGCLTFDMPNLRMLQGKERSVPVNLELPENEQPPDVHVSSLALPDESGIE
nr:unnamed protein product [Haemonchus contortus]